jgi:cathepsin A (carboxypeptidase C)
MAAVADYACDGPYPMYSDPNGPECQSLRTKIPTCQRLINSCYEYGSRFTCVPAALYCNTQLFGPLQRSDPILLWATAAGLTSSAETGLNLYDVRKTCDRSKDKDGPLCYKQMEWVEVRLLVASYSCITEGCIDLDERRREQEGSWCEP